MKCYLIINGDSDKQRALFAIPSGSIHANLLCEEFRSGVSDREVEQKKTFQNMYYHQMRYFFINQQIQFEHSAKQIRKMEPKNC